MTVGWTDPLAFLDLAGDDWEIACAIVQKTAEIQAKNRQEELKAVIDAIGKSVGNRVAEAIGRMF